MGCIAVPLLGILALCGGPRVYGYFYGRSIINEFRANRTYYESLVRQIESEGVPANNRYAFYIFPENRYAGRAKLNLEPGIHEKWLEAVFTGKAVRVERWNGALRIYFGMRVSKFPVGIPSQYGVMYCAGDTAVPGAEESLEKFEDRWWAFSWFLGR